MPNTDLISVQPRWWTQAAEQASKLAINAARVSKLLSSIASDEIAKEAIDVLESNLTDFSETADDLSLELSAIADGTSTYIIKDGEGDPGRDPVGVLALAQGYLAGHVIGEDVIEERVWEYGDSDDALPEAFESIAKRLRALPPAKRKAAHVFALLSKDAEPKGATPAAG